MTTTSRYCTSCGAPVAAGTRFCGQCGQAVQDPPMPPAVTSLPPRTPAQAPARQAPGSDTEWILGIVAVGKPKGLMGMRQDSYNMIVTPSRLVFAYVSPQLMKEAIKQARDEAKRQGKRFLGQWGAQLAWLDVLHRRYRTMAVDAILARYAGSFVVPNHQVRRVRYKHVRDAESGQASDELIIRTVDGKLRFKLLAGNVRLAKELLRQALGGVA